MEEIRFRLLDETLAKRLAKQLWVKRPYPHIRQDAIDPWLLFHKQDLLSGTLEAVMSKIRQYPEIGAVVALSYWGMPIATAIAARLSEEGRDLRCLCLGGEVLQQPLQPQLPEERQALLVDDVVHTGGTLAQALSPQCELNDWGYIAKLCVIVLDQDLEKQRTPLKEVLDAYKCEIVALTRTSLVPRRRRWTNEIRARLPLYGFSGLGKRRRPASSKA